MSGPGETPPAAAPRTGEEAQVSSRRTSRGKRRPTSAGVQRCPGGVQLCPHGVREGRQGVSESQRSCNVPQCSVRARTRGVAGTVPPRPHLHDLTEQPMSARRWIPIDVYLETVGESWQNVSRTRPDDGYGTTSHRYADEHQDQEPGEASARPGRDGTAHTSLADGLQRSPRKVSLPSASVTPPRTARGPAPHRHGYRRAPRARGRAGDPAVSVSRASTRRTSVARARATRTTGRRPALPPGILATTRPAGGGAVNFSFVCGWCGAPCVMWGEPVASWWADRYELPDEFECWSCGGVSTTPPPPWTPADD